MQCVDVDCRGIEVAHLKLDVTQIVCLRVHGFIVGEVSAWEYEHSCGPVVIMLWCYIVHVCGTGVTLSCV